MLEAYRDNAARIKHLECEIEFEKMRYNRIQVGLADELQSLTQNIDGLPHGSRISDPTANIATKLASGYENAEMQEIRQQNENRREEIQHRMLITVFVEAWLSGLNERERLIIEHKIIAGETWPQVIDAYEQKIGCVYSQTQLKTIKQRALEKIYRIAE